MQSPTLEMTGRELYVSLIVIAFVRGCTFTRTVKPPLPLSDGDRDQLSDKLRKPWLHFYSLIETRGDGDPQWAFNQRAHVALDAKESSCIRAALKATLDEIGHSEVEMRVITSGSTAAAVD